MTPIQLNISPFPHFSRPINRLAYLFLASILPICLLLLFLLPTSPASAQRSAEAESTNYSMTQAVGSRTVDAAKAETYKLTQTQSNSNYNFLISSPNGQDIYAYAINGDGTFGTETLIYEETTAIIYQGFAIADYDRDGDLDFASFDASGTLYLFKQTNPGNFDRSTLFTNTSLKQSGFIATDLNSDGYFDIVGRIGNTQGRIFINHGGNSFLVGNTFSYNNIDMAQGYEHQHQYGAGDFNGDGKTDLAIASYPTAGIGAGDVYILLGNGIGAFLGSPIQVATTLQEGPATITGDFNNDGFHDIISGQDDDGNSGNVGCAWIYFGNGDGTFIDNDFVAYDTYDLNVRSKFQ